jgi:hypothetical protein
MPKFYVKHEVEARQWLDTDEKREEFAQWFDEHDCVFETRGPMAAMGCYMTVYAEPGDWVVLTDDDVDEFFVPIKPDVFERNYTAVE